MRKLAAVFLSGILLLLMGCTNTEKPGEASGGEKIFFRITVSSRDLFLRALTAVPNTIKDISAK